MTRHDTPRHSPTLASLELFSKKLKKDITDERSYHGNLQVGSLEKGVLRNDETRKT